MMYLYELKVDKSCCHYLAYLCSGIQSWKNPGIFSVELVFLLEIGTLENP